MVRTKIIDTGYASAQENMTFDAEMLHQMEPHAAPILHLYDWKSPSITYGYFLKIEEYLCMVNLDRLQIDRARRPTGGGITFHFTDYAFSFIIPSTHPYYSLSPLESYYKINQLTLLAIQEALNGSLNMELSLSDRKVENPMAKHFCMAQPTKYDLLLNGAKVGGAAQRRTKSGLLHQGYVLLDKPDRARIEPLLLNGSGIQTEMQLQSCSLKEISECGCSLIDLKQNIKGALVGVFEKEINFKN